MTVHQPKSTARSGFRRILWPVLLGIALSACASRVVPPVREDPDGASDPLRAGVALRRITPDLGGDRPVYIGGLARGQTARGIHDDLYARALILRDPRGDSVGLVVLDLIGVFHDDVEAIREELARRHPEVSLDHLAVASTHTHAGPDVIGLWTPIGETVDVDYIARVRSAAVDAVAEAWADRRAARLVVGRGSAPGLAKDTRLPELIDDTVMVMGLRGIEDDSPIATLVNWNSHPSITGKENQEISADFPRAVVATIEREWGGLSIYTSGALGGQIGSHRVKLHDPETGERPVSRHRRAELVGQRLGAIALEALARAEDQSGHRDASLRVRSRTLHVPLENRRFTTGLGIGLIHARRLYSLDGSGAGQLPPELADPSSLQPGVWSLKTEVAVVDLGPARWALVPGELYPELSLGIYQEPQDPGADYQGASHEFALRPGSDRPVFIIGLANDELGYIIPKSQWDLRPPFAYGLDEGQYGERVSVGPETAPILMEAFAELFADH